MRNATKLIQVQQAVKEGSNATEAINPLRPRSIDWTGTV